MIVFLRSLQMIEIFEWLLKVLIASYWLIIVNELQVSVIYLDGYDIC